MATLKNGLTDRQQRFCDEYLLTGNGTQAAIKAGYAKNSAEVTASKLLRNPKVSAYIDSKREKRAEKYDLSQDAVLKQYHRLGFSDIRQYYNEDGTFKKITELSDDAAAAIAGIEVDEINLGGTVIGVTKKLKLAGKRDSLDSICRVQGYNAPEKVEHSIKRVKVVRGRNANP